jgi:hypothetical protein
MAFSFRSSAGGGEWELGAAASGSWEWQLCLRLDFGFFYFFIFLERNSGLIFRFLGGEKEWARECLFFDTFLHFLAAQRSQRSRRFFVLCSDAHRFLLPAGDRRTAFRVGRGRDFPLAARWDRAPLLFLRK